MEMKLRLLKKGHKLAGITTISELQGGPQGLRPKSLRKGMHVQAASVLEKLQTRFSSHYRKKMMQPG